MTKQFSKVDAKYPQITNNVNYIEMRTFKGNQSRVTAQWDCIFYHSLCIVFFFSLSFFFTDPPLVSLSCWFLLIHNAHVVLVISLSRGTRHSHTYTYMLTLITERQLESEAILILFLLVNGIMSFN